MIIKKEDRVEHKNSDKCVAHEYPMHDKDINIAHIEIDGRYPNSGLVLNEKVKEIVYVTQGSGKIVVEGEEHSLNKGDSILLLPNQKYFFEGNYLEIIAACSPAWWPEQHKTVEEN
jgi:mannose-6-phosphate isomerase-like protein (cupin superfamily)